MGLRTWMGGAALLAGCYRTPVEVPAKHAPEIILSGVTVWLYHGAGLACSGTAAVAEYERQEGDGKARSVNFHFPPRGRSLEEGGRAAKGVDISADDVVGSLRSEVADASGNVAVRTGIGDRARTSAAHFDGHTRVVTGHQGVNIEGPEYRLAAPEFRLTLASEHLELSGGVVGRTEGTR